MRRLIAPLFAVLAVSACSSFHSPLDGVPLPSLSGSSGTSGARHSPAQVISPNGEPLSGGPLGQPDCDEAIDKWFDRVDTNHDDTIDRAEFIADAQAQFARMDLDHDGFVTADELTRYRMPTLGVEAKPGAKPGAKHPRRNSSADDAEGGEDPVMAADTNLDFQVSLTEFLALAESKFAKLAKDGIWTRDAVEAICHPAPPKE